MRTLSGLLLIAAVCAVLLPVFAQTPNGAPKDGSFGKPAAAPVPAVPEQTTASFGEWILRCESVVAPPRRVCEAAHLIVAQGQRAPIAQVANGSPAPNKDEHPDIVVPPNIVIGVRPQITLAKAGIAPIELTWQRCLRTGHPSYRTAKLTLGRIDADALPPSA